MESKRAEIGAAVAPPEIFVGIGNAHHRTPSSKSNSRTCVPRKWSLASRPKIQHHHLLRIISPKVQVQVPTTRIRRLPRNDQSKLNVRDGPTSKVILSIASLGRSSPSAHTLP